MTEIGGRVEPGFEGVADAFRANFEQHGEVGAATAVYVDGQKVVDLWGGVADPDTGSPYTEDIAPAGVLDHQGRHGGVREPAGAAR